MLDPIVSQSSFLGKIDNFKDTPSRTTARVMDNVVGNTINNRTVFETKNGGF